MSAVDAQTRVAFTHTVPNGAAVIVLGVPARVFLDHESREQYDFNIDVATRLQNMVWQALRTNPSAPYQVLAWDEEVSAFQAELELRILGPGIRYGQATLGVWRAAFERLAAAYRLLGKRIAEKRNVAPPPYPAVSYVGPGSLTIGLSESPQVSLFPKMDIPASVASDTFRMIVEVCNWVEGRRPMPPELEADDVAQEIALMTVEQLASLSREEGKEEIAVELSSPWIRYGDHGRVRLTAETKRRVTENRLEVAARFRDVERVRVEGVLDTIRLSGEFHLKDISSEQVTTRTVSCTYVPDMLQGLLRNFGQRVTVTGLKPRGPRVRKIQAIDVSTP